MHGIGTAINKQTPPQSIALVRNALLRETRDGGVGGGRWLPTPLPRSSSLSHPPGCSVVHPRPRKANKPSNSFGIAWKRVRLRVKARERENKEWRWERQLWIVYHTLALEKQQVPRSYIPRRTYLLRSRLSTEQRVMSARKSIRLLYPREKERESHERASNKSQIRWIDCWHEPAPTAFHSSPTPRSGLSPGVHVTLTTRTKMTRAILMGQN